MYSITLSSPGSLFGLYLDAGKAFGVTFRSVRPRALVILHAATETGGVLAARHEKGGQGSCLHRVWSRKYSASPSSVLLATWPMVSGVRVSRCSNSGLESLRGESQVGAQGAQEEMDGRSCMPGRERVTALLKARVSVEGQDRTLN